MKYQHIFSEKEIEEHPYRGLKGYFVARRQVTSESIKRHYENTLNLPDPIAIGDEVWLSMIPTGFWYNGDVRPYYWEGCYKKVALAINACREHAGLPPIYI